MEKKRIIENDKSTIESFIKELDDKKNEALQATWVKVNRYVEVFSRHFFFCERKFFNVNLSQKKLGGEKFFIENLSQIFLPT